MGGSGGETVVPAFATESVNRTLANIEEVKPQLLQLLSLSEPDVLALIPPLQRAQSLFLLAEATTTLFALRLRCTGVHPGDHPVKSEIERLSVYREKLQRFMDWSKAPLRPSTTLNCQAATRFIEHSLPNLTPAQKESMRDLSKVERPRVKYSDTSAQKKRKYQSPEKQSVQAAAKEFLEKAARELLGNNDNGLKGPLQAADGSDIDDVDME